MGLARNMRRLARKSDKGAAKYKKAYIEPLEPRILLSADLSYTMAGDIRDLTLGIDQIDDVDTIKLVDTESGAMVESRALAETSSIEIIGSDQDDVLRLSHDFNALMDSLSILFEGGGGNDALFGPSVDTEWQITGAGSGLVAGVHFAGVENLTGAADNEDTFVFTQEGTLAGTVDGGVGGFDTLVMSGNYSTLEFAATSPNDGSIVYDGTALVYAGLEPISASGGDVLFKGTSDDDNIVVSVDVNSGVISVSSPSIETINLSGVTDSFTIRGGAGEDTVTISDSLDIAGADLIIEAETITVAAGSSINTGSGDVTLTAIADADGSSNTIAEVNIYGQITTTGALQVTAQTQGTVTTENLTGAATNDFTDSATVAVSGSDNIRAGTIELKAQRLTSYSATGRNAYNDISGDVKAYIESSTVEAGAGGLAVSALDSVSLTAESPELEVDMDALSGMTCISVAAARNSLSGNTEAYIKDSSITATNGGIEVTAERHATISAGAAATSLITDMPIQSLAVPLGGTFSSNIVRGDVKAYAESSTLTTTGNGSISLTARDGSAIDATSQLSAVAKTDPLIGDIGGSAGVSIAFNSIGWNPNSTALPDLTIPLQITNALLGINFGTEETVDVEAYLLDNTNVSAAGDVSVLADSAPQTNATVSNSAETTSSGLYGAMGGAASGILASNMVSSAAAASIRYTQSPDDTPDISAGGSITVTAEDYAGIYANTKIVSSSITTNDGGVNVFNDVVSELVHDYTTDDGDTTLAFGDRVLLSEEYGNGGTPGRVYEFLGADETTARDLFSEDYSDLDWWKEILATELVPEGVNLSDSDSVAIGGIVVRNDARSDVLAKIENAYVTTSDGDVIVTATEGATILATTDATAVASGGSAYGTGVVIGANGVMATNMILSQADAYLDDSIVNAVDANLSDSDGFGNVIVSSQNIPLVDATVLNSVTSGDIAAGVTLAFNTVGWQAQDVLSQTLDTLISTDLGTEEKAGVHAYAEDTELIADRDVRVTAYSDA
ncbi:MAG: LEPR-XLL domain-containing protein, partial [Desulfatiglandaceae bacterium]